MSDDARMCLSLLLNLTVGCRANPRSSSSSASVTVLTFFCRVEAATAAAAAGAAGVDAAAVVAASGDGREGALVLLEDEVEVLRLKLCLIRLRRDLRP